LAKRHDDEVTLYPIILVCNPDNTFLSGRTLFYLCIAVYLYGDLAIYAAAVSKSLRDVACTFKPANISGGNLTDESPCWQNSTLTRVDAYR